jgi:GMP synthase (glutamine-hydrolysing)
MRILSVVHGPLVRSEFFGDVVAEDGHELDEWSVVDAAAPPRPLDEYDAVLVFGGQMNVDQEDEHPWLLGETDLIRGLLAREVPLLGVCLGGQLLAKAAGAHVGPAPEPERGFVRATITEEAEGDPIFGTLPHAFDVFCMHEYAFRVPDGAVELARSNVCSQAFRLGDRAWGVQFHPEIRAEQVAEWVRRGDRPNGEAIVAELRERIAEWQVFGAGLCRAFLAAAERDLVSGQISRGRSSRLDHSCHEPG